MRRFMREIMYDASMVATLAIAVTTLSASVHRPLAESYLRAIDQLAGSSVLYDCQMILSVNPKGNGMFRLGIELEDKDNEWRLVPLVDGTSDRTTLLHSRWRIRELLNSPKRYADIHWQSVKGAIRAVAKLTDRIRVTVTQVEIQSNGGTGATVFLDTEGKRSYVFVVGNGVVTRSVPICFGPTPFAKEQTN